MDAIKVPLERGAARICLAVILALWGMSDVSPGSSPRQERDDEVVSVRTVVSQDGVHPGGTVKAAFILSIRPGWHINGPELDDPFLIASTLLVEESEDVGVLATSYPAAKTARFDYADGELRIYEGEIVVGVLLKAGGRVPAGDMPLKAKLLYQACDDRTCLPPKTIELEIPLRVVPPSAKIGSVHDEIFSKISFEK